MSEERFVYVITDGEYSDYHIVGVYEAVADAVEQVNAHGGRVERYLLNGGVSNLDVWFVILNGDGSVFNAGPHYTNEYSPREAAGHIYGRMPGPYRYQVYVLARDQDHAVKIATEKLMQIKASGYWDGASAPTDWNLPVEEDWFTED